MSSTTQPPNPEPLKQGIQRGGFEVAHGAEEMIAAARRLSRSSDVASQEPGLDTLATVLRTQESTTAPPKTAAKPREAASGWKKLAEALADWTLARLVVRRDVYGRTWPDGSRDTAHAPVTRELLIRHHRGEITLGLHSTSPDNLCLALAGDVDAHNDKADPDVNWRIATLIVEVLAELELNALIFDSDGKGGFHVWTFFKKPVASAAVKWLADHVNTRLKAAGLPAIEFFPKQDEVTLQTPYGNWIRAPGKHHKRDHWTRIYDPQGANWLEGEAAALALIRQAGDMPGKLLEAFDKSQEPYRDVRAGVATASSERPDEAKVRSALAHCPNADLDYDEWLGFGMALNDWDQSAGLPIFLEWSRQSSKFDEGETRRKWDSFHPGGGLTIASVFKRAIDNGWNPSSPSSNGKVRKSKRASKPAQTPCPYVVKDGCICSVHRDEQGNPVYTKIAHFAARITREITRHDPGETTKHFEIEATHADGSRATTIVEADKYEPMSWVPSKLGSKFAIRPGRGTKDTARYAIQVLSHSDPAKPVEHLEVFTSLGWHEIGGEMVYVHAGGGINAAGPVATRVEPRESLAVYRLPAPDPSRFAEAVEQVLMLHDTLEAPTVASIIVSLPYRAVLGPSRFVPHFSGSTGTRKTSTACLATRFFAPLLNWDDTMPGSWKASAYGLEIIQHAAGDVILPIDNLVGEGSNAEREQYKANLVFNAQGDLTGRQRMRSDSTSAPRLDPRGTVISTGEIDPRLRSALARALVVEFKPGMIPLERIDQCHKAAGEGHYAQTIACYVKHLAAKGNLERQRKALRKLAGRYQAEALKHCADCHDRQAEAVGELVAAWSLFLDFAVGQGALTRERADNYVREVRGKLFDLLTVQAAIQHEADAGELFLELVRSLLASKRAVLSGTDGKPPSSTLAGACGWEQVMVANVTDWRPAQGAVRIGWIHGIHVYLDPASAFAAAERLARETHQTIGTQRQVMARLAETGRITPEAETPGRRRQFTRRETIDGTRKRVLDVAHDEILDFGPGDEANETTSNAVNG
jgi:hypothetical protein